VIYLYLDESGDLGFDYFQNAGKILRFRMVKYAKRRHI